MSQYKNKKPAPFEGAKGGGGGSQTFTRTPDTLRSADTVEAILAISEGPIVGLENGAKSFYVGDTILQNADGTNNFEYFQLTQRLGQPLGTATPLVPKLGGQANNFSVGVPLAFGVPVTRQIAMHSIDAIDLRLNVTQLFRQTDAGIFEHNLKLRIQIKKSTEASWSTAFMEELLDLKGKTTSSYIKELRIPVAKSDAYYWQVRITKESLDTNTEAATDVSWESYQAVFQQSKVYADTATIQILGQASNQFSSIPEFSGIYKGRVISVPTNYNPATRVYTGVWNGTFKKEWSDNPAWVLYDFILNDRYGMSSASPVQVDKYEFYEAAVWCDQMVPNGEGGTEPRFTFNTIIQEPRSAIEQARYIAGTMNGTVFDDGNGSIILRVDKDDSATHLFTPENVAAQGFQYSFSDINGRFNDITVSFINPETDWQEDRRRIFDQGSIDTYGRIPYDFIAVGCTKESEALRRAYYKMNTVQTETMMVSFSTNRLGLSVQPFDIILISDPDLGYALSGRIKSLNAGRTVITLRDPLQLQAGVAYTGYFRTPSGVIERTVTSSSTGLVSTFNVTSALPADTPEYCAFTISQPAGTGVGSPKPFRVIRIQEGDHPDQIDIMAQEVNRNKFSDSEALVVSTPTNYSGAKDPAAILGPTNVVFRDIYSKSDNKVWSILTVTLPTDKYRFYSGTYEVYSRPLISGVASGSFVHRTVSYGDTLIGHPSGPHEVKIVPRNTFGQTPPLGLMPVWNHNFADASSVGIPPAPVNSVEVIPTATGFYLKWLINEDQQDYVHHFLIKEGVDEASATILADNVQEFFYLVDPMTKRNYNIYIYAVSISFVESEAVNVTYSNAAPLPPPNLNIEVAYETLMVFFDRMTEIDIVGYRIQYRKVGESTYLDMNPSGLFDTAEPNTAYEFRAASQDALTLVLHDEIWSNPISARTRDTASVEKGFDEVRAATTTNLIKNGSFEKELNYWTVGVGGSVISDTSAPYADPLNGTSKILKLGDGSLTSETAVSNKFVVRPLMPYTASVDLRKDVDAGENHYFTLRVFDASDTLIQEFSQSQGKRVVDPEELDLVAWKRFSSSFSMPALAVWAQFVIVSNGGGILYADGVQVQRGSVATAFNPHVVEEISAQDLGLITNPDQTPPGVPLALSASGAFRAITLSWSSPGDSDVSYFEILRSQTNDVTTAVVVGSSIAPVYSDSTTTTGVVYHYWVRAVDASGNKGTVSSSVSASTLPLSSADYQDLSIVRAKIADASIDDAKIANLSVAKLTSGTISAGSIFIGNDRLRLEGDQTRMRVIDTLGVERVRIGKLAEGAQNYGIEIRDASGALILGATGLGLNVVGSGQLLNQSIDGSKIALNAISAELIAAGSITASKIQSSAITSAAIAAGAITADKIAVASLSAISSNIGTMTAGILQGNGVSAATNFWNLNTGQFWIGSPDQLQFIKYDPITQKLTIKGEVEFQSAAVDWSVVTGRPMNLAELDPDSATKLGTIQSGADVTANNVAADVTAISGQPAGNIAAWASNPAVRINQNTTTINGSKITTGSIVANKLDVADLSSISANIGTITAGLLRNTTGTATMNLAASGAGLFLNCNNNFTVSADGHVVMNSGQIRGDLIVDGTLVANKIANGAISQVYRGTNQVVVPNVTANEALLITMNVFGTPSNTAAGPNARGLLVLSPTQPSGSEFSQSNVSQLCSWYVWRKENLLTTNGTTYTFNDFRLNAPVAVLENLTGNVVLKPYIRINTGNWFPFGDPNTGTLQADIIVLKVKK